MTPAANPTRVPQPMTRPTSLDRWIRTRIGLPADQLLTTAKLAAYQLERLNRTLQRATAHSRFYRRRLGAVGPIDTLTEMDRLPLTTAADIAHDPLALVCVSQRRIARVVTLQSSGTTAAPKRIFFTRSDLERTLDFFDHGMRLCVQPGQRVLILLPGQRPDSAGQLLARALQRMGAVGIAHGPVDQPAPVMQRIVAAGIDALVGIPVQVLRLVRHPQAAALCAGRIKSVLLTTDYVPYAIRKAIQSVWPCRVHAHYGMTEMGLGGGVTCAAHTGYHWRAADLLVEIIDPVSLAPLPPGHVGEVVFTTLTRQGMPLIRYRSGDLAAMAPAACPCGSVLPIMQPVQGRLADRHRLGNGTIISMPMLDEALFPIAGLLDFHACLSGRGKPARLDLTLCSDPPDKSMITQAAHALQDLPSLATALRQGWLTLGFQWAPAMPPPSNGMAKRCIVDQRE